MSKHTPGPWSVGPTALIQDKDGQAFAGCYWDDEDVPQDVAIANARLIAAAPELLEALELADAMLSGAHMNANVVERKVRSAIAKAKGRT